MRIALAGNPNSGKTTMFNALTGASERVGNWAGVTVEAKVRPIRRRYRREEELLAVDLPGAYSMSPFTNEESITRDYIQKTTPDVIINIVDATNLSRSLFFTTQLLELGIPVVVALNKTDASEKKETEIDASLLSSRLGCPVLQTVSTEGKGLSELIATARTLVGGAQSAPFTAPAVTDRASSDAADRARFDFVGGIVADVESRKVLTKDKNISDKIDDILTSRYFGIPIFAAVMFLVFQISQAWLGAWIAEGFTLGAGTEGEIAVPGLATLIEWFGAWVGTLLEGANPLVTALLVDGVIGGVGAVVGFLPLVMVMYFLIALLEDCGYMARVSVVLDPIFKKVGLSGKSVIPFVVATGCAVPGVMACRTIRGDRERRATAMLAPFMPCGAKLPVIALFAGAFFDGAAWVGTLMYFVGILVIFLGALLVNATVGHRPKKNYFIMELPEYKRPSLSRALLSTCERGWSFVVKAATVILLCNTAVQVMQSFTFSFTVAESAADSILATVAAPFAYLFVPIVGVLSWQLAAAAITGFIAKENVVGTLAVCFVGLENFIDTESFEIMQGAGADVAAAFAITKAAALAYLIFNLFSPPCFAALGAMRGEMQSRRWFLAGLALQLGVGYTLAFFTYQLGTLFTTGTLGNAPFAGLAAVLVMAAITLLVILRARRKKEGL